MGRPGPDSCCTEGLAGLVVIGPGQTGPKMPDPIVVVGRQYRAVVHIVLRCSCIAEYRATAAGVESLPMMSWWMLKGTVPVWSRIWLNGLGVVPVGWIPCLVWIVEEVGHD